MITKQLYNIDITEKQLYLNKIINYYRFHLCGNGRIGVTHCPPGENTAELCFTRKQEKEN